MHTSQVIGHAHIFSSLHYEWVLIFLRGVTSDRNEGCLIPTSVLTRFKTEPHKIHVPPPEGDTSEEINLKAQEDVQHNYTRIIMGSFTKRKFKITFFLGTHGKLLEDCQANSVFITKSTPISCTFQIMSRMNSLFFVVFPFLK